MGFLGISIISTKKLNAIKAAARDEADKIVAALKTVKIEGAEGTLADAVADSIRAIDNQALTGQQKFEAVVGEVAPLVLGYIQNGGIKAAVGDVEDLARQLVQSVFNAVKSTGFAKLVGQLAKLLGL